jgi:hypothetical protein
MATGIVAVTLVAGLTAASGGALRLAATARRRRQLRLFAPEFERLAAEASDVP